MATTEFASLTRADAVPPCPARVARPLEHASEPADGDLSFGAAKNPCFRLQAGEVELAL